MRANIGTPPCPDWMRRNHTSSELANLPIGNGTFLGKGAGGARANRMAVGTTVRLDLVQISVLRQLLGGCPWLTQNWLFSQIYIIEYQ